MIDDGAAAHLQLNSMWKASYAALLQRARRGGILVLLEHSAGYRTSLGLIVLALEEMGMLTSHDAVRSELDWLVEQQLITLKQTTFALVATITQRGSDVAQERARNSEIFIGDVRPSVEL